MNRRLWLMVLGVAAALVGCQRSTEVVVFHAASLSRTFTEISHQFEQQHPGYRVRVEVSGSQVAARKVSELGLRADVVAAADAAIIDRMLIPDHAAFNILFATNEVVLAHKDHSRYTAEVTTENWPQVLLRDDVRLARVNPDTGPIGYRTLLAWQLTEQLRATDPSVHGLQQRLLAKCAPEQVVPDEAQLLALLQVRAVDYIFMYRSTAEEHNLKITALDAAASLGRSDLAATYARASTKVRMSSSQAPVVIKGAPILYGITIPSNAPSPEAARLFVAFVLSEQGRTALRRSGYRPLAPARCAQYDKLPHALRALAEKAAP